MSGIEDILQTIQQILSSALKELAIVITIVKTIKYCVRYILRKSSKQVSTSSPKENELPILKKYLLHMTYVRHM